MLALGETRVPLAYANGDGREQHYQCDRFKSYEPQELSA